MQNMGMMHSHMMYQPLLGTVQNCLNVCEHMVTMALGMPDVQARQRQIRLLRDCVTICRTMAGYLARQSPLARMTANLCANICEMCGTECARFPDQASQMCARVCLHCAQECREFARAVAGTWF